MDKKRLISVILTILICLIAVQTVWADSREGVRQKAITFAKPLEAVMVDGPFYLNEQPYYVAEFIQPDSTIAASLVYDASASQFVTEPETLRKILATKDLKKLTVADPLFYGVGNPSQIIRASKYETQNVRNFATFSSITPEEENILKIFLEDYEVVMGRVADVSALTQAILYPEDSLDIKYQKNPPEMKILLNSKSEGGRFSYEGFQDLIIAYEELEHDYKRLSADLTAFAGGLPEYPGGAVIREKWEIKVTKEGILQEVALIESNGDKINEDIKLRRDVLDYPFDSQLREADNRLGLKPPEKKGGILSKLGDLISRFKNLILGIIGLTALLTFISPSEPPRKGLPLLLLSLITASMFIPVLQADTSINPEIPTMNDLISKKVSINQTIPYSNHATGLNDSTAKALLRGFRMVLEGESIVITGPYHHYNKPYYFFDIQRDGVSTGSGFLVDVEKFRLVGDQRQAFQLLKTLLFSKLLKEQPLYIGTDPGIVDEHATATIESPLDLFLGNLSTNMNESTALEEDLLEDPDFETLMNLTSHYVEAFILIQNIKQLVTEEEAEQLTDGFSKKLYLLDAYSRATRGLSAQEYLQARTAQYRGRTLNRLPLITQLSIMGLRPSKAQVAHDLTSDLVHDNPYLWRLGRVNNPNLFARLSFREGTFTTPKSIPDNDQD